MGAGDIITLVADEYLRPAFHKPRCDRAPLEIASADVIAEGQQHLRDAAHPYPADADEVDMFIFFKQS
jgi:hypothetical protein